MNGRREPDPQRLIAAHAAATEFYRRRLQTEPRALIYLRSHGIVAATAHTPPWTIGYAPRGWTRLCDDLRGAGYTDHELLAAGLATTASTGHLIDVFRNRVMFPIRNPDGHVVAFTGRDLSGRVNTPKYRNTTTTAIYSKKHLLYGLAEQLDLHTQPAAVMLVEGPTDAVAVARLRQTVTTDIHRQPYTALAPCGTALTAEQITVLTDAVPPGTPLIMAFDPDTAGRAATEKAYQLLRHWPGPLDAIPLPTGTDPAELVAHSRKTALNTLEQARRPLTDLLIEQRISRFRLDEIPDRFAALHAAAPLIADTVTRDIHHAARQSAHLATRLDLNPLTVHEAVFAPAEDTAIPSVEDLPGGPNRTPPPIKPAPGPPRSKVAARIPPTPRTAIPLGGPGFPDPDLVGHQYARICPPGAPAATWVERDPTTGHTAWVLAEGITNTPGDRHAARLAAEVAGRAAVLVGAHKAIAIARTALNAHFAQPKTGRGDAAITVLTTFTDSQPAAGSHRLVLAWAGDINAYGSTGRWFALLTTDHTRRDALSFRARDTSAFTANSPLTASVRGGAIGTNHIDAPLTQIVLTGRALAYAAAENVQRAVEWRKPADAITQLAGLGSNKTAAFVIRPRSNHANHPITAAQLAHQDQPTTAAARTPAPLPSRAPRRALAAAPAPRRAAR